MKVEDRRIAEALRLAKMPTGAITIADVNKACASYDAAIAALEAADAMAGVLHLWAEHEVLILAHQAAGLLTAYRTAIQKKGWTVAGSQIQG